jgi:hypothetical protein
MNDRHQQGLLGEIGKLAAWAAAIYLVGCLVGWLLRRKATEWFGWVILLFIPISLIIAMVVNTFIYAVEDNPWPTLCSDRLFRAEAIIGLVTSVVVGIAVATDSNAPARKFKQFAQIRGQRQS